MVCVPGLDFGATEGARSDFHVLRSRTHFGRYQGRRVQFLCFALLDLFSTVLRASSPIFMVWATRLIFSGTKGVVLMFCSPELIFGDSEGVGSHFHVLCTRTHFGKCRVRRAPIACFAHSDAFSMVPRASGPAFMFGAPRIIFDGTEGTRSSFLVLLSRTHFQRYRGRRVIFSCFALPESFSAEPRASGLVFMFCAPRIVFNGSEGVWPRFQVLRPRTRFGRYRDRWVPFSYFALSDLFGAVLRALGPVIMFCVLGLVFDGTEGVGSRFDVSRSLTLFGRYRGRRVPFLCFSLPDHFWAAPRAPGSVFMFCAPHLGLYRGRRAPFSCFELPNSLWVVPSASSPVFIFSSPGIVWGGTKEVGSRFDVLRSRTHFWR
jgi:hypothetical protein